LRNGVGTVSLLPVVKRGRIFDRNRLIMAAEHSRNFPFDFEKLDLDHGGQAITDTPLDCRELAGR